MQLSASACVPYCSTCFIPFHYNSINSQRFLSTKGTSPIPSGIAIDLQTLGMQTQRMRNTTTGQHTVATNAVTARCVCFGQPSSLPLSGREVPARALRKHFTHVLTQMDLCKFLSWRHNHRLHNWQDFSNPFKVCSQSTSRYLACKHSGCATRPVVTVARTPAKAKPPNVPPMWAVQAPAGINPRITKPARFPIRAISAT